MQQFKLNSEQENAIGRILHFLSPESPYQTMLLQGRPGVGKTYLLQALMQMYKKKTVFTAPTNKATKVLKAMLTTDSFQPNCRTIYSLLGLQLAENGEVKTLQAPEEEVDLSEYSLLIIDESFMVNSALKTFIDEVLEVYSIKILFVGDSYQLPPVKEHESPIVKYFDSEDQIITLTQVMRHGGLIQEVTEQIRTAIDSYPVWKLPYMKTLNPLDTESDVQLVPKNTFHRLICAETWDSDDFDKIKVIAWRNTTVDVYNKMIRQIIFPNTFNINFWEIGDKITITSPVKNDEGRIIGTVDEEGIIQQRVSSNHPWLEGISIIAITALMNDNQIKIFRVLDDNSKPFFSSMLANLANEARTEKRKWKNYWDLFNAVHYIRHAYAITAHRAQGSTYEKVFIDQGDILVNSNRLEALRCLYVAASRAKKSLIIGK